MLGSGKEQDMTVLTNKLEHGGELDTNISSFLLSRIYGHKKEQSI